MTECASSDAHYAGDESVNPALVSIEGGWQEPNLGDGLTDQAAERFRSARSGRGCTNSMSRTASKAMSGCSRYQCHCQWQGIEIVHIKFKSTTDPTNESDRSGAPIRRWTDRTTQRCPIKLFATLVV